MALQNYSCPDCVHIDGELRLNLTKPLKVVINGVEVMVIDADGNLSVKGTITSATPKASAQAAVDVPVIEQPKGKG